MFGLANGFCDQKPERSEMNWPIVELRLPATYLQLDKNTRAIIVNKI